jgi:hemerythrin-like domain-containing protein
MKPRGPLMKEHRLIEKMLDIIDNKLRKIEKTNTIDTVFIDTAVDFIRTYADRTHHGKEEDILFTALEKKKMSSEDNTVMKELIEEHKSARIVVRELREANGRYSAGPEREIDTIVQKLRWLKDFYPKHIIKEDKIFFPNTEKYFTTAELDEMLNQFWEFDKNMIHEKYLQVVNDWR